MTIFEKFIGHLKTVLTHKKWVFYYCYKAGIPWQGIKHDLSKFSPTEFIESVKWYQGDRSPIDACKEANGISMAWMHHKGRNPHHYEFWVDYLDLGGKPQQMPFNYALEMMCDYMGAGRAYSINQAKEFTFESELKWWQNKKSNPLAMHSQTKKFVDIMFETMVRENSDECLKKNRAKVIYDIASIKIKEEETNI